MRLADNDRPPERDPACYVMLDAGAVTFHRVSYGVAKAAEAIRPTGWLAQFAANIEPGAPRPVAAQ
jgi:hypothetical protein